MPYVESQVRGFQEELARKRTRQYLVVIPVAVATALLIASRDLSRPVLGIQPAWLVPLIFLAVAALIGFSLVNWRCPACNGYLGKRINPRFCASCGVELRPGPGAAEPRIRA